MASKASLQGAPTARIGIHKPCLCERGEAGESLCYSVVMDPGAPLRGAPE